MGRRVIALTFLAGCAAAVLVVVAGSSGKRSATQPADARRAPAVAPAASAPATRRQRRAHRPALPGAPAQVRGAAARRMPIPILMFHVIGTRPPSAPYPELWVTPATFGAEMAALRHAGYWAITLRQAYDGWQRGGALPRRPVVVSFDDGYLGDYTHARPVLRRLGWPGVLNLELRNVRTGDITAAEVRALVRDGWEVDSHTIDHADLTTVGGQQLQYELVASRRELTQRFGVPADFFCYPAGRYDARVVAAVRAAGYLAATTTTEGFGTAASLFTLDRVRVRDTDTAATLLLRLRSERPAGS